MLVYEIINSYVSSFEYRTYLEIGVQHRATFDRVNCYHKTGVDPNPVSRVMEMTSDEFFELNDQKYDIIFIDGLHHADQVKKDIRNALKALDKNGTIIVHDCNPLTELAQRVPRETIVWNGDVWKAWVYYRSKNNLNMFVIDTDTGCGVIRRGKQKAIKPTTSWKKFSKRKKYYLNLINIQEWSL